MKNIFLFLTFLIFSSVLFSQEFKIQVSVSSTVQGTDRKIYESMQTALNDFINNRKWTNFNYKTEEKIEGSISILVKDRPSQEDFKADYISIQLRRPVYNSSYTTTMLNSQETDYFFKYVEGAPLEFEENTYYDNLTSTIAFYLYYFLALDAASFSPNGGAPYFRICQNIVTAAQKSAQKGWKSFENQKNKYWISENYNNPAYRSMHDVWYNYHLLGLDRMASDNQVEARNSILTALEALQKTNREKTQLICVQQFVDAKADEIVQIFKEAPSMEKERVITIMCEINPANTNKYEQIRAAQNNQLNNQFNTRSEGDYNNTTNNPYNRSDIKF
ncbi:MAG: DUF4835 family protein [Bacteroidales bacterium]|nr:DUF4835 family protein [Bacteroidales bacterium]MDD4067318.1 DUF4835 family protein [Bacteroidales bacterium]